MIRRGSPLSRALALLVVLTPLLFLSARFAMWADEAWSTATQRLVLAETRDRALSASLIQAEAYDGLLERWREFAQAPDSGLGPPGADDGAAELMIDQARRAFEQVGGRLISGAMLSAGTEDGLRRVQIEVVGATPGPAALRAIEAIEAARPFLFIEHLALSADAAETGDRAAETVVLRLRASGLRLMELPPRRRAAAAVSGVAP